MFAVTMMDEGNPAPDAPDGAAAVRLPGVPFVPWGGGGSFSRSTGGSCGGDLCPAGVSMPGVPGDCGGLLRLDVLQPRPQRNHPHRCVAV